MLAGWLTSQPNKTVHIGNYGICYDARQLKCKNILKRKLSEIGLAIVLLVEDSF